MNRKIEILIQYFIENEIYEEWGPVPVPVMEGEAYELQNGIYYVLDEKEAEEKAKEEILRSLCYFNSSFILKHSIFWDSIPYGAVKEYEEIIKSIQEKENSELIKVIIKDINYFIEEAIRWDGRGHFISTYDGEEIEQEFEGEYYYIYRIN